MKGYGFLFERITAKLLVTMVMGDLEKHTENQVIGPSLLEVYSD